jgi:hypothetical protein
LYVVTRPPAPKLFALHRQLADQLGQQRVVWVTPGGQAQVGDGGLRALLPIEVELACALIQEHVTGRVALLGRQGSPVGQELRGDPIPREDVGAPPDHHRRDAVKRAGQAPHLGPDPLGRRLAASPAGRPA